MNWLRWMPHGIRNGLAGAAMLLLWLAMTGCRSQQIALRFRAVPLGHVPSVAVHQEQSGNSEGNTVGLALASKPKGKHTATFTARRLPGHREASGQKQPPHVRYAINHLLMKRNAPKPVGPLEKRFLNKAFLCADWHDSDTDTTLSFAGIATLAIAFTGLGISISGIGGIVLLLFGVVVFPFLLVAGIVGSGMALLHYNIPSNSITTTATLAFLGALAFGIAAVASLGFVAWVPLALIGAISTTLGVLL